jgi:DNA-binding GntR family transcriptional regulator
MVQAIKDKNGEQAAQIMKNHVQGFYEKVFEILKKVSD